jgi:hypothetical protein
VLSSILTTGAFTGTQFLICTGASLVLGILCALVYMYKNDRYNKNFVITLALMPAIVQMVIMLVNGNIGTGVAVMGAFNLVRFRSYPGTAKDIGGIFFAMAVGIATGMGYLGLALIFILCMAVMTVILNVTGFGGNSKADEKQLRVTIPENLDYTGIFDDIFQNYTESWKLTRVKTTDMGSLFELTYIIRLKDANDEKKFIDDLRCRNGNLKIICGLVPENRETI